MTVKQLKTLLKDLPADMEIFIDDGNMLSPIGGEYEVKKIPIGETVIEREILILQTN